MTSMLPLMENSLRLLSPSGETLRISILVFRAMIAIHYMYRLYLVFRAMIRFRSVAEVKLPWVEQLYAAPKSCAACSVQRAACSVPCRRRGQTLDAAQ